MNLVVAIVALYAVGWVLKTLLGKARHLLLALMLFGCGSNPAGEPFVATGSACTANDTKECACPGMTKGAQTCLDDGSGWGKCICSETSGTGSTSGAGGSSTGTAGTSVVTPMPEAAPPVYEGPCDGECIGKVTGGCTGMCDGECNGVDTPRGGQAGCMGVCSGKCTMPATTAICKGTCN
jgi:hypothetical protein